MIIIYVVSYLKSGQRKMSEECYSVKELEKEKETLTVYLHMRAVCLRLYMRELTAKDMYRSRTE